MAADRGGTAIGRLEYQRRPEVASVPVRLTPRPVFLAGREGLLAELDARLAGGPGRPGPRVAVLCGLGGAGKTSVAVEYAHRHLAEVGVCWQFPAEDREVLAAEFGVLAAELGGLPLALEQAAAYMQATGTTLARYLPLFRDRQADLLARGEASGHPADVAATLGLALSPAGRRRPFCGRAGAVAGVPGPRAGPAEPAAHR